MEALEDTQYFSITFPSFFLFHIFSPRLFFPEKKKVFRNTTSSKQEKTQENMLWCYESKFQKNAKTVLHCVCMFTDLANLQMPTWE